LLVLSQTLVKIDKDKNRKVDFTEWMAYMEGLIAYMDGAFVLACSVFCFCSRLVVAFADDRFNKAVKNMIEAAKKPASTKERVEAKA
jgi:hypothetical protein